MGVEVSRLSNGLTVATETLPSIESVAMGVWVKSGSRNEREDEHGIAHLLEHMAFKGTEQRSAWKIASEIENVGGEINAATSVETTAHLRVESVERFSGEVAKVMPFDYPLSEAERHAALCTDELAAGAPPGAGGPPGPARHCGGLPERR